MVPYANFYLQKNSVDDQIKDLEECLASLTVGHLGSVPACPVTGKEPAKEYILNYVDECPICSSKYKRKGDLKNHLISHHFIEETCIYFECSNCRVRSGDQKKFTRHAKSCKGELLN